MGWLWRLACIALFFVVVGTASPTVMAAAYPERPVRFIVPFPPGGGLDIVARLVGDALSRDLGWKVLIDNRGGVGGAIVGTEAGAKAAPDGYTLTYGTNATHGIFGALYRGLPYDPVKDFVPVTKVAEVSNVLVVNPSLPAQSLEQLIALAKSKPGALNYAAAGGLGSQGHLAMELMKGMAGIQIEHVGYQGPQAAVADLLSGRVQMMITNIPSVLSNIRSGRLRAVAVVTAKRTPLMPDLPTVEESGLRGYASESWWGLFAPAGTAPEIVSRINVEVRRTLKQEKVHKRLLGLGLDPEGTTPEEFAHEVKAGMSKWAKVIKDAGVPIQ